MTNDLDDTYLNKALELSSKSIKIGGFPVGVVIISDGLVLSEAVSNGKQLNDPTSHAEIAAIREAALKLKTRNLSNSVLYSSMEPCLMCYGATVWASIPRVIFACSRDKLSKMHFEGHHQLKDINNLTRKPIELVHYSKLESTALKIIEDWEKSLQKS